jgi:hypothetical protein
MSRDVKFIYWCMLTGNLDKPLDIAVSMMQVMVGDSYISRGQLIPMSIIKEWNR